MRGRTSRVRIALVCMSAAAFFVASCSPDPGTGGGGNAAPTAKITVDTASGPAPLTVHFDGSTSTDPEGGALTYSWNFADGSPD